MQRLITELIPSYLIMKHLPLARLLRPKTFHEIHGHNYIVDGFKKILFPLKHHTFLLTGSRGLGKTSLARLIAAALLCPHAELKHDPCGLCDICDRIQKGQHPDLVEIDGASKTKVEEIRDIISSSMTLPLESKYKIYLIDEVHMLSMHSFNALLKNLEEPPPHVIFVLATTEFHKIPGTIRSRCLIFQLQAPPAHELVGYLKSFCHNRDIPYEDDVLFAIAQQADGSYRDMLNIVEYSLALTQQRLDDHSLFNYFSILSHTDIHKIIDQILESDTVELKNDILKYFDKGLSADKLMKQLMSWIVEQKDIVQQPLVILYQELSKCYQLLATHPYPQSFVLMSLIRISMVASLKKKLN
ncbi:DNA polymerase III subunit gamma/tau [bacterium]|nr:DNA polymerase III subunit gamma/tau [bacterium]NBX72326.1 DNA polymerase III subunit gamma/tau [bacterium]